MWSWKFGRSLRESCGAENGARGLRIALGLCVLAFGLGLLAPRDAHAKFVLINTGQEMYDVGDLPPELQAEAPAGNWKLGYLCSRLGIFWADIWTWDCNLVAYEGTTYADLPPDAKSDLELMYPMSEANRSLWNKFGVWCFVGLAGIGVFVRGDEDD
jgi:hypothetical protein